MKAAYYQDHAEYVFSLQELKSLINNAPSGDDAFFVTIGFECINSSSRVYNAKIEGTTGIGNIRSGNAIAGCPKPPDCPQMMTSLGVQPG